MHNKFLRFPFYLLLFIMIFVACDNGLDDVEPVISDPDFFVSSELITTYTEDKIDGFINLAMLLYPDQKNKLEELKTSIETGVKVHKIVYNTEFGDNELQASGLVCLPMAAGSYPILSYQNGTNTLHSAAPTKDPDNQLFQILEMMGSTGFIIALPDYLGFGESEDMFHPYLHKESTVQSVLDMLRAVEEMVEAEESIEFNNNIYLSGYSQGGWATMAVHEAIQKQYSGEFKLKASACGAGPYNLNTINEYVLGRTQYPQPYFLAYIFNTYQNIGLSTAIGDVFQQPYADRIPTIFDGTKNGSAINSQLTETVSDLFTADYLNSWSSDNKFKPVSDMLEENSISAFNTSTPILLTHGTADNYVPPIVSDELYDDFINLGMSNNLIEYIELDGMNHSDGIIPSGLASITWFIQLKNGM